MTQDDVYAGIAENYDGDYAVARTPCGDVEFYVEEARRCGGPVAEFGCGTGRILVPTARAGIEIAGVDKSESMLAQARAKQEGLELYRGDMRDFEIGRSFRLVTIPFRALSHIEAPEDQLRVFLNMRRHLAPDGRLIFDLFQPSLEKLAEARPEALGIEREQDGKKIRRYFAATAHPATQMLDVRLRWEVEDAAGAIEESVQAFPMRWFYRFELQHLLARAGLEIEALWGNFDRSPLQDDSPEYIFVVRPKPAGDPAG